MMALARFDFPDWVAPALSQCGTMRKSITHGCPVSSRPGRREPARVALRRHVAPRARLAALAEAVADPRQAQRAAQTTAARTAAERLRAGASPPRRCMPGSCGGSRSDEPARPATKAR